MCHFYIKSFSTKSIHLCGIGVGAELMSANLMKITLPRTPLSGEIPLPFSLFSLAQLEVLIGYIASK